MAQRKTAEKTLADKLLDAQVDWIIAELSGDRLGEIIARDVDDVLAVAKTLKVGAVVQPEAVKAVGRRLIGDIGASPLISDMVAALSDAIYDLDASGEHNLGDVIDREPVEALIAKVLSMPHLHEELLERLGRSPLVATVASKFVTKIISDFVQQNRARAEKVPGMRSMISLGASAASKVKSPFDKQLDSMLGDAAGKGAQAALKRTSSAVRDLVENAPLQEAALEVWDLHADEPISNLRDYLTQQDLRELALIVHEIVVSARNTDFAGHLLDACVDVFFDKYGQHDVAALLTELGVSRDNLVSDAQRLSPPIIEAARAKGVLAKHIRARLAPFYASDAVTTLLAPGL